MTAPSTPPVPPDRNLSTDVAAAAERIARQNDERAAQSAAPVRRDRSAVWLAVSLVALAAAVWFERNSFSVPEVPAEEQVAIQTATVDQVRVAVESYRDSTGAAPATLDVVGMSLYPVVYSVAAGEFRIAAPLPAGDSVTATGPARRVAP